MEIQEGKCTINSNYRYLFHPTECGVDWHFYIQNCRAKCGFNAACADSAPTIGFHTTIKSNLNYYILLLPLKALWPTF